MGSVTTTDGNGGHIGVNNDIIKGISILIIIVIVIVIVIVVVVVVIPLLLIIIIVIIIMMIFSRLPITSPRVIIIIWRRVPICWAKRCTSVEVY